MFYFCRTLGVHKFIFNFKFVLIKLCSYFIIKIQGILIKKILLRALEGF